MINNFVHFGDTNKMVLLLCALLVVFGVTSEGTQYEGYKVYRIRPSTQEHLDLLHLYTQDERFDFWSDLSRIGFTTDIMVVPQEQKFFEETLQKYSLEYETLIEDVSRVLKEQPKSSTNGKITFKEYLKLDAINQYLKDLAKQYPKIVTLETVGRSYEGREITAIKISNGTTTTNSSKPVILIDGGIHAREWISPATVLYVIDQLVVNKSNSALYTNVDWYLVPVINPDGYEYTHTKDRLWRKTRSPGKKCNGTDANRNFDYHWGAIGASDDECSTTYKGKSPFSETEMLSLANFAKKYSKNIKLYINVHSYGQLLLYPWSDIDKACENEIELQTIGNVVSAGIAAVNGTNYTVGYWYKVLYPSSGTSIDFMYANLKIPMTYTLELPDRGYGFVMPPQYILGVVTETFAGIELFGKYIEIAHGLFK